jgi:hypothetical protein
MNEQSLQDRLRFKWADNGAGYNTEYTADLNAAADVIDKLQAEIERLSSINRIAAQAVSDITTERDALQFEFELPQELKPCPFCGSDAVHYAEGEQEGYYILCSGNKNDGLICHLHIFGWDKRQDSVDAWNRRTP